MNKARFLLLASLLVSSVLTAGSLPFYAEWQSLNSMYYDTIQSGKELSWDELYRAEFGFKNLRYNRMNLYLALATEQFFDESHIKLKTLILDADFSPSWILSAGSREHGYGTDFAMDNLPVLMRGYDSYNYQMMRLNSLGIRYNLDSDSHIKLDLGGNTHNQPCGMISYNRQSHSWNLALSEEIRTMDSHWRTPVSLTSFSGALASPNLAFKASGALAILPGWDSTKAHHELYLQAETSAKVAENTLLDLGAAYTKHEYAPFESSRYQLRLQRSVSEKIELIPLCQLSTLDSEELWQYRLLGTIKPLPHSQIGLYYDYSHFTNSKGRHSIGMSLSFGLDLSDADIGM